MADRYGSVDGVKTRTGVKYADLGLEDDDALEAFLEDLLDEATDLMDRQMRKSYLEETVPKGLDGIACDVVADSLRVMVQSRQTPIVRIDDFVVRTIAARTLSADIVKRLRLYGAGGGVSSYDIGQDIVGEGPVTVALTDPYDPLQTEEVTP